MRQTDAHRAFHLLAEMPQSGAQRTSAADSSVAATLHVSKSFRATMKSVAVMISIPALVRATFQSFTRVPFATAT
ncbi:hypothetical protein IVA88_15820 [Bradyrhizobium sp. 149]|uniref:hypothetical protein n=1 Tax=Bradyrhizobium sp. 149 TaxID=2782624 RepID=UPI001FF824A1|nr:hypothetical protein [Bradyrhizobium sp. 149]MCK1652892.1 hypothetical protein [Bradyrhizobium sp. 149]